MCVWGVYVWGWANNSGVLCVGDSFLGIINLFYYKLKEIRETTMSIYSNQGCVFF